MGMNGASGAFGTLITLSRYGFDSAVKLCECCVCQMQSLGQFVWVHSCVTDLFCMHPLPVGPVTIV